MLRKSDDLSTVVSPLKVDMRGFSLSSSIHAQNLLSMSAPELSLSLYNAQSLPASKQPVKKFRVILSASTVLVSHPYRRKREL